MAKVWKAISVNTAQGEGGDKLAKALNSIETKMEGTVFAVLPKVPYGGGWDVVYYVHDFTK